MLAWDDVLLRDLVGVVGWFEEVVCYPSLKCRETCGHAIIVDGVDLMAFDVFKELVRIVVAAFPGSVLRVDSLHITTSTDIPLTRSSERGIVRSLRKLTVGRI